MIRFITAISLCASGAFAGPIAELSSYDIDLGVIEQGTIVDVPLAIRNSGDEPLVIEKVQFSCHCASARELTPEEKIVGPGASFALPITYDPMTYTGKRETVAAISTNDPKNGFLEARIRTTIVAPVAIAPRVLRWGSISKDGTMDAELRLRPGIAGKHIEVLKIQVPHPDLEFTQTSSRDGDDVVVQARIALRSSARVGEINSMVEAVVKLEDREITVSAPLSMYVSGDATVRPQQVINVNRAVPPGTKLSTVALVSSQPDRLVEVIEAKTQGPIRAEVRSLPDRFEIDLYVAMDALPGPHAAQLDLFTTSRDEPVSTVPVFILVSSAVAADPPAVAMQAGTDAESMSEVQLVAEDMPAVKSVESGIEGLRVEADGGKLQLHYEGDDSGLPLSGYVRVEFESAPALTIPVLIRSTQQR